MTETMWILKSFYQFFFFLLKNIFPCPVWGLLPTFLLLVHPTQILLCLLHLCAWEAADHRLKTQARIGRSSSQPRMLV